MEEQVFDYIVIGSGFGGSVSAMRLSEKGYRVAVVEMGKRWKADDFPKSNWNIRKFLWLPLLKCFGIQKLDFFRDVFILSGTGVGGGSLVYANTHMVPPDAFFQNNAWSHIKNWKDELMPFYDLAKFMLGTVTNRSFHREDKILQDIAREMNKENSFAGVNVGVYFGDINTSKDPYFKGLGPERNGCIACANCMVGCKYNAKNTLDKNYLFFAEKFGAKVIAETKVTKIEWENDVYTIHTEQSTNWFLKNKKSIKSKGVVFSAGVLGTMDLLLKQKFHHKTLPNISDMLGYNVRTNSESICGVGNTKDKLNNGVAITSIFNPDEHTHIEIVKYGNGSGAMGLLGTLAVGNAKNNWFRTWKWIIAMFKNPINATKVLFNYKFPENAIILLVMQTLENSMQIIWKKTWRGGKIDFNNKGHNQVPAYIESGQQVMYKYAEKSGGVALNAITEISMNMSTTAHIIGGCPMGNTSESGVVNEYFQVFGYPNMLVLDGSIIPCNLGVNPSLTITALSEYAMSKIPEKAGNSIVSLQEQMDLL